VSGRALAAGLAVLMGLVLASSCQFQPDLSRFPACTPENTCDAGFTCLAEERICLPDCGSQCTPEPPDASTDGGMDDGGPGDAGPEDGGTDDAGTPDAGADGPLSLVTTGLPPATETVAYSVTLRAQGGKPPYTLRLLDPLPPGLSFNGGVISGTPTTPATATVTVEVRDQGSPSATLTIPFELRVRPLLRIAGPQILVNAYLSDEYVEQVYVTGGTPPYAFSLASGNPPPAGLRLETDGGVKGTPSASGAYELKVRVTDSDPLPQTVSRDLELNVQSSPLLLAWATRSVPDGRVGTPYHYVLKVAGASSANWQLEAGVTPPGIGFDASKATLQGTPTQPGYYSFTISASAGLSKVQETFGLRVY
jgi:hypothetical protein